MVEFNSIAGCTAVCHSRAPVPVLSYMERYTVSCIQTWYYYDRYPTVRRSQNPASRIFTLE